MKKTLLLLAILACLTIQTLPALAQGQGDYSVQMLHQVNDEWVPLLLAGEEFKFFIDDGLGGYLLYPTTNALGIATVNVTYCESWQYKYIDDTYTNFFPSDWWWCNWSLHENDLLVED